MASMLSHLELFCLLTIWLLAGAGLLHLFPRLGQAGRWFSEACCRAPVLDMIICYFTILPLVIGPLINGWSGLLVAILSQLATLLIWQTFHEVVHRDAVRGPRIVKVNNKRHGTIRNITAVYITALATPVFWIVRLAQLIVYPPLVLLVNLPAYNAADWVSVSRQKFHGLVGHDLIWCLYCDWMTGVWSLGSEMLRNVESWGCPIRFSCEKKCENCAVDFPDVNKGWVHASGSMAEVVTRLEQMYPDARIPQFWFGHPGRTPANTTPEASHPSTGQEALR